MLIDRCYTVFRFNRDRSYQFRYRFTRKSQDKTRMGHFRSNIQFSKSKFNKTSILCLLVTNTELHDSLKKFWEIEENDTVQRLSKEEHECEQDFVENFMRDSTGRFTVKLPMRKNDTKLENSLQIAA